MNKEVKAFVEEVVQTSVEDWNRSRHYIVEMGERLLKRNKNVLTQVGEYLAGYYDSKDFQTQCNAGWYDWFCKDSSLPNKTHKLYKKVIQLLQTKRIRELDLENTYVFFKNNCPMSGSLYDDIRFCDIETGDVLFTIIPQGRTPKGGIIPRSGFNTDKESKTTAQVHGNRLSPKEEFVHDAFVGSSWKELIKFLNK